MGGSSSKFGVSMTLQEIVVDLAPPKSIHAALRSWRGSSKYCRRYLRLLLDRREKRRSGDVALYAALSGILWSLSERAHAVLGVELAVG